MANKFYTRFNPRPPEVVEFNEPSLTQEQYAYESNINNILKTITDKEGRQHTVVSTVNSSLPSSVRQPLYGDFTQCTPEKYMDALNIVTQAKQQFLELPSALRSRFENSPTKLVEFLSNSDNYEEALKLGLINKRVDTSEKVPITPTIPTNPVPSTEVTT